MCDFSTGIQKRIRFNNFLTIFNELLTYVVERRLIDNQDKINVDCLLLLPEGVMTC